MVRDYRHLRNNRLRKFQRSADDAPDPGPKAPGSGLFRSRRARRWVSAGWLAVAVIVAPGSTYVSVGEATLPLMSWQPDLGEPATPAPRPTPAPQPTPVSLSGSVRPPVEPAVAAAPASLEVVVESGDTLASVLERAKVPGSEAHAAIEALRAVFNPRSLQVGQEIALTLVPNRSAMSLVGLELSPRFDRDAGITLYPDGQYRPFTMQKALAKQPVRSAGIIQSSLLADGIEAGVPASTMTEFMRLFSFVVDFERDVQPDDQFEVVFEQFRDRDGRPVHTGNVLYAGLTVAGVERGYYRFRSRTGDDAYYDVNGQSLRQALLRTPVDGARKSSGYGMRRHPISGYTKMHKGIDFAAPRGTPIRAAGDGVIAFAGRNGGYGNYIRIRHNGDYTTAYAHMYRFAKGMRSGQRVKQGQVIGYVGSTGRSTGPHLHYEVLYKGKHANPSKLRLPSGARLAGAELERFKAQVAVIDALRRDQTPGTLVAARPE